MVHTIIVKKILSNEETEKLSGTKLPKGYFKQVFTSDIDVKTEDGKYLLRFRKNILPNKNVDKAYNALIAHAKKMTSTRGIAGGENNATKRPGKNNKIASNIIGYFDTFSIRQKFIFKQAGMADKIPKCRATAFTMNHPDKWKQVIPLIKDINSAYKKLFPLQHKKQKAQLKGIKYKVANTAFSTITTNLNLQTAAHKDKGDFIEGFGNLVVIEKGKYSGGFTGFPQYGIAVDVRSGDFLGMDVHQLHGNEPIQQISKDAERLSLVSYLREGIIKKCKGEDIIDNSFYEMVKQKAAENRKLLTAKKRRKSPSLKKTKKKLHKRKGKTMKGGLKKHYYKSKTRKKVRFNL